MPTTYTDQFYLVNTQLNPVGETLTPQRFELIDVDDNGIFTAGDIVDGATVSLVYENEYVIVNVPGVGDVRYDGATIALSDGRFIFTPLDNQVLSTGDYVSGGYTTSFPTETFPITALGPTCYVAGSLIKTPNGAVPVERLQIGDLVISADHGAVPIKSVHTRTFNAKALAVHQNAHPIRISQGALGNGCPTRDILVSPQHRVLLRSRIVERMYDTAEVLAPAVQLTQMPGIEKVVSESVTYVHLVFSDHQVIFAEGAPMESLLLGPQVHESLTEHEIQSLMDDLGPDAALPTTPARPLVKGSKLNTCLKRHIKNDVALLAQALSTHVQKHAACLPAELTLDFPIPQQASAHPAQDW